MHVHVHIEHVFQSLHAANIIYHKRTGSRIDPSLYTNNSMKESTLYICFKHTLWCTTWCKPDREVWRQRSASCNYSYERPPFACCQSLSSLELCLKQNWITCKYVKKLADLHVVPSKMFKSIANYHRPKTRISGGRVSLIFCRASGISANMC